VIIFSVIAIMGFAYVVPIPAALGALELGQASLFGAIGIGASVGFVAGILIRARDLVWTFLGLAYLVFKGLGIKTDFSE